MLFSIIIGLVVLSFLALHDREVDRLEACAGSEFNKFSNWTGTTNGAYKTQGNNCLVKQWYSIGASEHIKWVCFDITDGQRC